ncbi:PA2169 family four-helix-bundle protein [Flavisericum labens]|uniref:PA2169 family four-helix-bundle protein n=1 Tax=Flavisericum labens TaxID=3377112 RepID=UPI00387ABCFB
MKNSNPTIAQLNELLAINYEAEKVYLHALNQVESEDLKHFFRARAFERSEFCRFLGAEIIQKGGQPEYLDQRKGGFDKLWVKFKQVVSKKDEYAIFDEVCKIKTWSVKKYNKVLKKFRFSENISQLLQNQRDTLERSMHSMQIGNRRIA